jgi:hypothetical protein
MGKKEGDLEELIIVIVILCICFCCISGIGVKIYEFYDTYTFLEKHEIKSLNDVKDFFKEMLEKLWDWIQCNILGIFLPDYRKKCFTDAVILSEEDEIKLDSAEPGSLGEALWELTVDQRRQKEDFDRANKALTRLLTAIKNHDAAAIFNDSDEVEMDEEILYHRAWITAQTSQMTHNMVNMEICGQHGKVSDYMDLAATGLDKDGQLIPDKLGKVKSGKDFRWSNRCKNTGFATALTTTPCPDMELTEYALPESIPTTLADYWIKEVASSTTDSGHTCTNDACLDPSGSDKRGPDHVHNDLQAFHLGDFSGYNCKLYETLYCKEGYPDYDNFADMFGIRYNWPELNCCACGGGSRTDVVDSDSVSKNKYEFVSSLPYPDPGNAWIDFTKSSFTSEGKTYHFSDPPEESDSMINCIKSCNASDVCIGIAFNNCAYNPSLQSYIDLQSDREDPNLYTYFNPHSFNPASNEKDTSSYFYKPKSCRLISGDAAGNFFNRNSNRHQLTDQFGSNGTQYRLLKKMPTNFQNLDADAGKMNSEEINPDTETDTNTKDYPIKYDKPIKKLPGKNNIQKCEDLCVHLNGYETLPGKGNQNCGVEGCQRSICCKLDDDYRTSISHIKNALMGEERPSSVVNSNENFCGRDPKPVTVVIDSNDCATSGWGKDSDYRKHNTQDNCEGGGWAKCTWVGGACQESVCDDLDRAMCPDDACQGNALKDRAFCMSDNNTGMSMENMDIRERHCCSWSGD